MSIIVGDVVGRKKANSLPPDSVILSLYAGLAYQRAYGTWPLHAEDKWWVGGEDHPLPLPKGKYQVIYVAAPLFGA